MKLSMALLVVTAFSSFATAGLDITGDYTFTRYACESGAAPKLLLDGTLLEGKITGDVKVTSDVLSYKMILNYKYSDNFAKFTLGTLRDELKRLQDENADDNKEEIDYLVGEIANIEKMSVSQICTIDTDDAYTITGNEINTTVKSFVTTCDDMKSEHESDSQKVSLVDGVLKLAMTEKSNHMEDATCADGDNVVLEFTKKQ